MMTPLAFVWAIAAGTVTAAGIFGTVHAVRGVRYVIRAVRQYDPAGHPPGGGIEIRLVTTDGTIMQAGCRDLELMHKFGGYRDDLPRLADGWASIEVLHTARGLVILQFRRQLLPTG